ncbi:hypothetical protein I547_7160 [Mycobacterium kansasii 824]|nr:hypothetical protein I547_7160 [Mycobacterium kansasii 824]
MLARHRRPAGAIADQHADQHRNVVGAVGVGQTASRVRRVVGAGGRAPISAVIAWIEAADPPTPRAITA